MSIDAARAELLARWPSVQSATLPASASEAEQEALLRQRLNVGPLASRIFWAAQPDFRPTLWLLLGLMGILLAVACANLAGLTLARSLTPAAPGRDPPRWVEARGACSGSYSSTGSCCRPWRSPVRSRWRRGWSDRTGDVLFGRHRVPEFLPLTPDAGVIAAAALLTVCVGVTIGLVLAWRSVTVARRREACVTAGDRRLVRTLRARLARGPGRDVDACSSAPDSSCRRSGSLRANDTSLQSQRIVFTRASS